MKYAPFYQSLIGCTDADQVFDFIMNNLIESITYWDYFVGWNKALGFTAPLEIDLNTLNYLVGKADPEAELRTLINHQPTIANLIPVLLACREKKFTILTNYIGGNFQYERFSFRYKTSLSPDEIDEVCRFANQTGLLELFKNPRIKSVPDYVLGIQVGLDSNARKNRSGTRMERIVHDLLAAICDANNFDLLTQATPEKIKKHWSIEIVVDKANRNFDFAVKNGDIIYLMETNYYGSSGTKPKSVAGEFKSLHNTLIAQSHKFLWITDGVGWGTSKNSLKDAFNQLDYILNLKMVTSGVLQHILVNKF